MLAGDPGENRAFWEDIRAQLEENKFRVIWDKPSFREFVAETPRAVGEELARRDRTEGES